MSGERDGALILLVGGGVGPTSGGGGVGTQCTMGNGHMRPLPSFPL